MAKIRFQPETADNKMCIEWNPSLEIGIPMIDAQHKKLIETCNDLYTKLMNREQNESEEYSKMIADAVRASADYAKFHFAEEEKLLKAVNYKDFVSHKKQHDEFILKVIEIAEHGNADFMSLFGLAKFLYEWILEHIAHVDKLYVPRVIEAAKQARAANAG
jgi:hemerythrin